MQVEQIHGRVAGTADRLEVQGELFRPARPGRWGVLVLGGSSGRLDAHAAGLLGGAGAVAFAQRWFGQPGLPPRIEDVPLELFMAGLDLLAARGCDRLAVLGRSRGAEAALLLAVHDPRVALAVALSPSAVAWAGDGPDGRPSWTHRGEPVPFVRYDLAWWSEPRPALVEYLPYHLRSLRLDPHQAARAAIPVERAAARFILVAGGADLLWPSEAAARSIAQRLRGHGRDAALLVDPEAGHRVLLPGDTTPRSQLHAHGGTDVADAALGARAWDAVMAALADDEPRPPAIECRDA